MIKKRWEILIGGRWVETKDTVIIDKTADLKYAIEEMTELRLMVLNPR